MRLFLDAFVKLACGVIVFAMLLFTPAGTLDFPGAWRLIVLLFAPMTLLGIVLLIAAPDTLRRRLKSKEKRSRQNRIVRLTGLLFITSFIVAGVDYRYGWSSLPDSAIWAASILFIISYMLYAEVMRENEWLSRRVEVMEGQKVISNGLYGIVRHPMYTSTVIMFLSMPMVIGSWWAFAVMAPYVWIIVQRIKDEEELLNEELEGYKEYCITVRWRLLPHVW